MYILVVFNKKKKQFETPRIYLGDLFWNHPGALFGPGTAVTGMHIISTGPVPQ